jgi:acyl dehydratase
MGAVLAVPAPWLHRRETGITWKQVVLGEQGLQLHRIVPVRGSVRGETRVEDIVDKGAGKGALIYIRRAVYDVANGELVATVQQTLYCRADGGFGGPARQARPLHQLPDRTPDFVCDLPTSLRAALIYRLSGDMNPLHVDPAVARAAKFPRPILHGLCSFGVAAHAILRSVLNYDAARLLSLKVRFSSPVFPGETLRTEVWRDSTGQVSFRCRVTERDVVVLDNGLAELR